MLVSIYSAYGQKVTETVIKPGDNSMALAGAAKGIYVIRFSSMDGMNRGTKYLMVY